MPRSTKPRSPHFKRTAKPLTAFTPEGIFPGYPQPKGDSFDPERGKKLLVEAGYGNSRGEFDPSKFPIADVELTYNTSENNTRHRGVRAGAVEAESRSDGPDQEHGMADLHGRQVAKLQYKGMGTDGLDRRLHGSVHVPGPVLDARPGTTARDGSTASTSRCSTRPTAKPIRRSATRCWRPPRSSFLTSSRFIPLLTQATNWVKKPYVKGMFANPATLHAWKFVYIEHDRSKWDDDGIRSGHSLASPRPPLPDASLRPAPADHHRAHDLRGGLADLGPDPSRAGHLLQPGTPDSARHHREHSSEVRAGPARGTSSTERSSPTPPAAISASRSGISVSRSTIFCGPPCPYRRRLASSRTFWRSPSAWYRGRLPRFARTRAWTTRRWRPR